MTHETIGLIGANGAGKSTLLRVLAGRGRPDGGTVDRFGTVGYLPQTVPTGARSVHAELLPRSGVAAATRELDRVTAVLTSTDAGTADPDPRRGRTDPDHRAQRQREVNPARDARRQRPADGGRPAPPGTPCDWRCALVTRRLERRVIVAATPAPDGPARKPKPPVQSSAAMSASTMTFEETLAALFELVGSRVTIRITAGAVGDPAVTIAFIDGALRSAIDRGPAVMAGPDPTYEEVTESDSRFFSVDDLDQTGFYVSPQAFVSAQWLGTDPSRCLWIEHGPNVVLSVVAHR